MRFFDWNIESLRAYCGMPNGLLLELMVYALADEYFAEIMNDNSFIIRYVDDDECRIEGIVTFSMDHEGNIEHDFPFPEDYIDSPFCTMNDEEKVLWKLKYG